MNERTLFGVACLLATTAVGNIAAAAEKSDHCVDKLLREFSQT